MNQKIYSTKSMRNQKEKERIFKISMNLMKKVGYDNLTIRKICEKANISTGMFYRLFESKVDLLSFYYVQAESTFEEQLKNLIEGDNPKEQSVLFYTWYAEYTSSFGVDFCRNYFNPKNLTMNTERVYNKVIEITNKFIINGMKNGYTLPKDKSPNDISRALCVIVKGAIFEWCAYEGCYNLSEYVNELLSDCVEGLM